MVTIVEGLPKGLGVSRDDIAVELARRRHGYGRGKRMGIETDELEILGGVRHGRTLGSPVAVVVRNTEWPKWQEVMSVEEGQSRKELTRPRPGHADLAGMIKYATGDARDILERASARETAARTVAGTLAKKLLAEAGVVVVSHVVAIGEIEAEGPIPGPSDLGAVDADPVRCFDARASAEMVAAIDRAQEEKDTLGGVVEVVAYGVPPGIGSHVHYDRRLDAALAAAVVSIPAIKGAEIGDGFAVARTPGSAAHDEIIPAGDGLARPTNRAGGIEGGMSNGEPIRVRGAMKPLSTLMQPLRTVDLADGSEAQAFRERSDVCAVPAAAVVAEHMVAITLAREFQRKFGGDTVDEFRARVDRYREEVARRLES